MGKAFEFLAIILTAIVLQCTTALAQNECVRMCMFPLVPFANCDLSSIEHPKKGRIGIVGRVVEIKTARPSCNTRVSIEVVRASVETMPSRIDIDIDGCTRWVANTNDVINVHVLALADARNGSYPLAACSF